MQDGIRFESAEHFYTFKMAKHFNDEMTANKILRCEHAGEVKQMSNHIFNFNKDDWRKVCDKYMLVALKAKFTQNEHLGDFLKGTGEHILVEANPRDKY